MQKILFKLQKSPLNRRTVLAIISATTLPLAVASTVWPQAPRPRLINMEALPKRTTNVSAQGPEDGVITQREQSKQTAPDSAKETTPYSTIVEENGRKWRVFDFPEDTKIGNISVLHQLPRTAKGKLKYALNARIEFEPSPIVLKWPNYIKRFRRGDIFEATISNGMPMVDDDDNRPPSTTSYLKALSVVPGIQSLCLMPAEEPLSSADTAQLEHFASLKSLIIFSHQLDTTEFSKLSILRQLESLYLVDRGDMMPILKALKNSTHVKSLLLTNSAISLDGLAIVARWPNLQVLQFVRIIPSTPATSIRALNLLSNAPQLQTLSITNLPINPDALIALKSFKRLETLTLGATYSRINPKEGRQILMEAARLRLKIKIQLNGRSKYSNPY